MLMKKLVRPLRAAAGLLAALTLCGCVAQEPAPSTTAPTQPTQASPTLPSRPTVPTVPSSPAVPEPAPVPELEAVTYLTCAEFDVFPRLLNLGNGLVVASRNTYNDLQGLINETLIIDVYNDVCGNYQYYWYRYSGMLIGQVGPETIVNEVTNVTANNVTCKNVTVIYGDWANYTYCEFAGTGYPYVRVQEGTSVSAYSNVR